MRSHAPDAATPALRADDGKPRTGPSSVSVTGKPWKTETIGTYTEPTGDVTKSSSWDVTTAHGTDASASFTGIGLKGGFYNSVRGGGNAGLQGMNLVLGFDAAGVETAITPGSAYTGSVRLTVA